MSRIFHGPAEWLVRRTSARTRRAINFWLLAFWIVPGVVVWYVLRDVLWFVGFMSIYAIWTGHLGALSAETPVEEETKTTTGDPHSARRGGPSAALERAVYGDQALSPETVGMWEPGIRDKA